MANNKPNKIIIHHSLTKDNKILKDFNAIKNYHVNTLGWKDIGYHFIIEYIKGKLVVLEGRKMWQEGAHTKGQNLQSIGYCIVGNFDKEMPGQSVYDFIAKHIVDVVFKYYNNKMTIHGHREYKNKTCPGLNFDIDRVVRSIKAYEAKLNEPDKIKTLEEIFDECLNSPDEMLKSINYIKEIASKTGDIGVLESLKYIKLAFKKVYYHDKNMI